MVIGTGLVQASFFRQSMIEREAAIVRDMVFDLTVEQPVKAASEVMSSSSSYSAETIGLCGFDCT